MMNTMEMVGKK